jgi:hypothetical protein
MNRHRMEVYLDKVFDFSRQVDALPDGRSYALVDARKVFDAVFFGSACQFGPVHRIETECRQGMLRHRIGAVSEDTMGYVLERQDPAALFQLGCQLARQLKRNGVFASTWSRGLLVVAVDGIEICSSYVRCCAHCMEREIERKVGDRLCKQMQYYHRLCLVTVVSSAFPIPLGIRFQKNGESEVACALALLEELSQQLGRRFADLLVADALYLQTPFVRAIEKLGFDWLINLKANQPELLAESERILAGQAPHPPAALQSDELQLWYAPQVDWAAANRDVSVVKTVRTHRRRLQQVRQDEAGNKRIVRQAVIEQSTNFYASHFQLGSVPPFFLHQLGRSRWQIDTDVFQTITNQGALKQPSLHQGYEQALVVLTMIRVLAFTLTQVFYHRQVRSHFRQPRFGFCDLARRLAESFLGLNSSLDSS